MMTRFFLIYAIIIFAKATGKSQVWSLQNCIQYAINNNTSIKQNVIQEKIADIQYKQSKLSQYPSINFSNNEEYRFGKSQNPSTGILENRNFFSIGLNFQTSMELFNWYSKRNTILANKWQANATKANTDKIKNDIALSVINAYLQILLESERENIAEVDIQQSRVQLAAITKQVQMGALPQLNAIEMETQLANDSINLITAKENIELSKYTLKELLNIDAKKSIEIEKSIDNISTERIADLLPEIICDLALMNSPKQKVNSFKLKAAYANLKATKGALYPIISAYGNLGTNYGYSRIPAFQQIFSGYQPTGLVVPNGTGGYIDVQSPVYTNGDKSGYITSDPLGSQLNKNFGQSIGISISFPLFNGYSAKGNYESSKLHIQLQKLQNDLDAKVLIQNIYRAYYAAVSASEKFTISQKLVISAQKAFDFALKRYNLGMLTTLDLITNQNNLLKAKLENTLDKFDYIFKIKILEFYKGDLVK